MVYGNGIGKERKQQEGMEITIGPKLRTGNKVLVRDIVETKNIESAYKGLIA